MNHPTETSHTLMRNALSLRRIGSLNKCSRDEGQHLLHSIFASRYRILRRLLEVTKLRQFTFLTQYNRFRCISFPFQDSNAQNFHYACTTRKTKEMRHNSWNTLNPVIPAWQNDSPFMSSYLHYFSTNRPNELFFTLKSCRLTPSGNATHLVDFSHLFLLYKSLCTLDNIVDFVVIFYRLCHLSYSFFNAQSTQKIPLESHSISFLSPEESVHGNEPNLTYYSPLPSLDSGSRHPR